MTTPTTVNIRLQLRADTAANWTAANPILLANELGRETDTGKFKVGDGSTAWGSLAYQPWGSLITDADIAAGAEIAVSKLANGTANQVLVTDGTDVSWSDDLTIAGNLTVNGTTTTVNTETLVVEDKNIELGVVGTPTDLTADGGGITLKGTTDKTINWVDSTDAWTSSERFSVPLGSAASPSLIFTGDENSGLYSPGADQVAISTAGTGRLFVDASGKVGVNTSSEGAQLHVLIGTSGKSWTAPTGTSALFERNSINYVTIAAANNNTSQLNFADTDDADIGNIKYSHVDDSLSFGVNNSERFRCDSSGRLLVGTSTVAPVNTPKVCSATSSIESALSLAQYRNSASISADLDFVKSRSGSVGTAAAVSNTDTLAQQRFYGAGDASTYVEAARITANVDGGTVSSTSLAGRLVFSTTADGASSPTERMRIKANGTINFSNVAVYADNAAATSGGLAVGDVYRTATGQLMIRY